MSDVPLLTGVAVAGAVYLLVLVGLAFMSRRARRDSSLADFYLAGRDLGTVVLVFTLYATQYSGNSLLGYPGEAYRVGFSWMMSISFMTAIVLVYLTFAPRLQGIALRESFVTPGDYFEHRFRSPSLTAIANLLLVIAITNYLLAQLMATGHIVAGLSNGALPYWSGVLLLALVVVIYETVGGLRAVAWTDLLQGLLLLLGLCGLMIAVVLSSGGLGELTRWLLENRPELAAAPDSERVRNWVSTVILVGFSGAVYPQAIQRIYAARSADVLRRSLGIMVIMPLVTMPVVVLVGLYGVRSFAEKGLPAGVEADQVMPLLLNEWSSRSPFLYVVSCVVALGAIAAIMSTADSVLLSLSSILSKDVLGKTVLRGAPEETLTRAGKVLSWGIMGAMVMIALTPRITLWGLTVLKNELLIQVAPLFILGVSWSGFERRPALLGILLGTAIAVAGPLLGTPRILGVHVGVLAFAANLGVGIGGSMLVKGQQGDERPVSLS